MKQVLFRSKNPSISRIVECIGYVELSDQDSMEGWFGLFPDGTSNLTISLNDQTPILYDKNVGDSLLFASWNSPVALKRSKSLKFINVQFKPYGLYHLKGIPMNELHNTSMSLDLFTSRSENEELLDRLYSAPELAARFLEVERFLVKRIRHDLWDDRLPFAVSLIKKSDSPGLDYLSGEVCLSNRRFRELFTKHIGLSPGFYRKTVRFNKASRQLSRQPGIKLTDVAYANGYYDQSHFIKDFKYFAGITPSQYLRHKARISDFYNFDIPIL